MINSIAFATRLKKIMEYYNLTASAFSDEIDFNRSTISHLLAGRNKPSLDFVMKVLHRFPEVTISWFLYGKGNFPTNMQSDLFEEEKQENIIKDSYKDPLVVTNVNSEPRDETLPMPPIQDNATLRQLPSKASKKEIKKIIIFYTDFSFDTYEN